MKKYICFNRFKGQGIYGEMNIPYGTEGFLLDNFIFINNKIICAKTSENAHQYFAINEDGRGLERGALTQKIQNILKRRDINYQKRWNKIWKNQLCNKFKRTENKNYFLWNDDFFNASIEDLMYIYNLIKEV